MSFEELMRKHVATVDLDIRKKPDGYSRYMDQKVTPDVLTFIADCIVNFLGGKNPDTIFTTKDIWDFPYFQKNTVAIFSKPSPINESARAEYDKFIAQPLKTLAFAKILKEEKVGVKNTYKVLQPELLEYISQNERNSLLFLVIYIEKVLSDSVFIKELNVYKDKALAGTITKDDFDLLKGKFETFMRGYTNINGDTEIRRIFPKVLNPYAVYNMINGTEDGHMSENRFVYSDLMYNRENFRDIGKDKALTRTEGEEVVENKPELSAYKTQKAKNIIRRNHSSSEVHDSLATGEATQVHHIFPEHEFPEISAYIENLILLTPQQHNTKAHPSNHTQSIDRDYQKECLLSKIDSIERSLKQGKDIYSIESLTHVINIGLSLELSTKTTFDELRSVVKKFYL
jgi:hypothetical protein